ncbi:MAG: phosphomannomutase CpsG, partial [Acidiferrobacterales bacterium]|nr:phosphomannomutase CpsG [Acidiferrobacterales bacterium]
LAKGLSTQGVDVLDIGLAGTEEIYFATSHLKVDGGIEVTASHNPIDYNGMKFVREDSKPIGADSGLKEIEALVVADDFATTDRTGSVKSISIRDAYIEHLLSYIDLAKIKPLKIVANSGNGTAGPTVDALQDAFNMHSVPIEFIKIHHEPDGTFPNGIPNPMIIENQKSTSEAVLTHDADFGLAWDGDFDRCFFFDEKGQFIEGYYIVGLLAEAFLKKYPGEKIVHDPRVTWNTIDIVKANGGTPVLSKCGHAFIKQKMREVDAVYGGEMSAHHYFRDFFYCDSGMIPWLLIAELVCVKNQKLSEMVADRIAKFPSSGEINRTIQDADEVLALVEAHFNNDARSVMKLDGLSMEFPEWRFNLRKSNTEPLVRLNVETRANLALLNEKTNEILKLLKD